VLVVGGTPAGELYDPSTGTWTATRDLIEPRAHHAATLLDDGRVLVVGGTGGELSQPVALAETYDPDTGRWTAAGTLQAPRGNHSVTRLADGRVLVVGGVSDLDGDIVLASVESFDPKTGAWTSAPPLSKPQQGPLTVLPDGRVLLVGGIGPAVSPIESRAMASVVLYDPVTGRWTAAASLAKPRFGHTATLLDDGRVLVVGGGRGFGASVRDVGIYDPVRDSWTAAAKSIERHFGHTATLLADGRVLVAGGYSADDEASAAAELYDPVTDAWTVAKPMLAARTNHSATLLRDGTVLVVGNTNGEDTEIAELYDPGT
jgi:N-acetylneuraminic acid mutarotase